jgi:DNA-binding MarR family transcriptional regulator
MTRSTIKKKQTPVTQRRAVNAALPKFATAGSPDVRAEQSSGHWTFLTNHSHVLILLARNPSMILREVAAIVGITERAVQKIIADLEVEGCIEREKVGRQNHYRIIRERRLRHTIEAHRTIGDLLNILDKLG